MYVLFTFVKYQTYTGSLKVWNIAWLLYIHSIKLNSMECYLYLTLNSYMNARNFNEVIQYRQLTRHPIYDMFELQHVIKVI